MASSKRATKASVDNESKSFNKAFDRYSEKKQAIREKYKDRGTSGKEQMKKELLAVEMQWEKQIDKRIDKSMEDDQNVVRYGKDAMKGRSFAQYNKGGMANKKMGYATGGLACGASNPAARPMKKGK